jgi:hypothetical protein
MCEVLFLVEAMADGGSRARAVGQTIYTQADDVGALLHQIIDAVHCHFDEGKAPQRIRLQFTR